MDSIEISPTLLILAGLICVGMGIFATMLLNTLREDEITPAGEEDAPPGGKKGKYTPVFRLWRERSSGRVIVEVDGKSLVSSGRLSDEQRQRMEQAARDLNGWLGIDQARGTAGAVEAQSTPDPAVTEAAAGSDRAATPETALAAAGPAPVNPPPADLPGPVPPAADPIRPMAAVSVRHFEALPASAPESLAEAAAVVTANKSIVMQIEDILQEMLTAGPLANRAIHLTEDPERGVIVSVGASIYEGIDSVLDPEVKAAVRAAVVEWERRQ